jgi:hypothetical protein
MPQIAIALPRFSGSKLSTIVACESGTTLAPNAPCSRRNMTICSNECACPQSMDETTKPATLTVRTRFRPNRSARKPLMGMTMASATI